MTTARISYPAWAVLIGAAAAFVGFGIMKDAWCLVNAFDTGLYLQLLHNLSSYGSLASSVTGEANFFAHHFQPIIVALVPFYLISPHAGMLFALAAAAILSGMLLIDLEFARGSHRLMRYGFVLAILFQPCVASRLCHSFVPEVLAFPLLTYEAIFLARDESFVVRRRFWLLGAMLLAGLTKESVWLVNAFVAMLLFFRHRPQRRFFAGLSALNLAIFAYLFLIWMPGHSNMTSYYGLRYFTDDGAAPTSLVSFTTGIWNNVFSLWSLDTLLYGVLLPTLFLPVVYPNFALWGALPGLLMILASNSPIVHHGGNQYLLLTLPFLLVSAQHALAQAAYLRHPRVLRYLCWILPVYAFFFTLFYGGILHSVDSMRLNPGLASAAEEIARVKHDIGADAYLLVDGNFQPHLADVRNVGILQNFAGNPRLLGEEDFKKATDVITLYDLSQVGDCGAFVREGKDFPSYQWDRLEAYCRWIRDVPKATWRGPRSGLLHYKILRN